MEDLDKRVEAAEERWQEKITVTVDEAINEAVSIMQGARKDLESMAPVTASGALAVEHKKKHLDLCMKKLETLRQS
jgi:hypothetical protein